MEKKKKIELYERILTSASDELLHQEKIISFINNTINLNYFKNVENHQLKTYLKEKNDVLWRELYDYFLKNDFFVVLTTISIQKDILFGLKHLVADNKKPFEFINLSKKINKNVDHLIENINDNSSIVSIINLLIENEQYDKISEIISNPKRCSDQVICQIMRKIIDKKPEKLNQILATIPKVDYLNDYEKTAEGYQKIISKRLKESISKNDLNFYMYDFVYTDYPKRCLRNLHIYNNNIDLVKTFMNYDLVNYENIIFYEYLGNEVVKISAAAKSFTTDNYKLSDYLYRLEDNKKLDEKIRHDSDKFILKTIVKNIEEFDFYLYDFLNEKNFISTPDKFKFLCDLIDFKKEDYRELLPDENINLIYKMFAKKTNQDDLEKIVTIFNDFKRSKENNKVLTIHNQAKDIKALNN